MFGSGAQTGPSQIDPSKDWANIAGPYPVTLTRKPRALYIGTSGDVVLVPFDGSGTGTFKNVPAGTILDVQPSEITSGPSDGIVALY